MCHLQLVLTLFDSSRTTVLEGKKGFRSHQAENTKYDALLIMKLFSIVHMLFPVGLPTSSVKSLFPMSSLCRSSMCDIERGRVFRWFSRTSRIFSLLNLQHKAVSVSTQLVQSEYTSHTAPSTVIKQIPGSPS